MKTLAIPLCLLVLFTACRKVEMPQPMDSNSNLQTSRVLGDTLIPVVQYPFGEHAPLTNDRGPRNPIRDNSQTRSGGSSQLRVSGELPIEDTIYIEHKPLKNGVGIRK
jgi:hypothetical protein